MRDLVIDLALPRDVGFRDSCRVNEVEHSGLITGQPQSQQLGHDLGVGANGVDGSGSLRLLGRWRHYAGCAFFRPLKLSRQLGFYLADGSKILVQLNLIRLAHTRHESLALLLDCREYALTKHDRRIRLPIVAIGVLEARAEQPGVEGEGCSLRHGEGNTGASRIADGLARYRGIDVNG